MSQYIQINRALKPSVLGQIIQIEGELLVAQVKNPGLFELGEPITCQYRSYEFESSVLGMKDSRIFLLFPFQPNKSLNDRRRVARVNVDLSATLMVKHLQNKSYDVHNLQLLDASILGFSIRTQEEFPIGTICTLLPQSDQLPIKAEIKIRNQEVIDGYNRFGLEIKHITPNHFHVLRKFVLSQQLYSSATLTQQLEELNEKA